MQMEELIMARKRKEEVFNKTFPPLHIFKSPEAYKLLQLENFYLLSLFFFAFFISFLLFAKKKE